MVKRFVEYIRSNPLIGSQITSYHYIPPKEPLYADLPIHKRLKESLRQRGIERLWSHQVEGIKLVRSGENVVVMTPTASGKTLIYNIPVIESLLEDPSTKALYIYPLKGLEQDQIRNLNELLHDVGIEGVGKLSPAEVYDGDTTPYRRRKIREWLPPVVFTNPDMLHLAINAFHPKWEGFLRRLRFVVIDEIHAYRGVFGSNVSQVLRRFRRICERWGSHPQFIASSATIANPDELAGRLVGLPFRAVTKSGAPLGGRHFIFMNPIEGPYTLAIRLLIEAIRGGLKTIVFTKARKVTELIYRWCTRRAPDIVKEISPYRAGFLPSERREIEKRLFSGELSGVVSTSALELGIDVGGLDCCILVGYPGSVSSTWQRAGRVGRHGEDSLVILIALKDALDQYIVCHPERVLQQSFESVVIDPDNEVLLRKHLPCAASEVYLRKDDSVYPVQRLRPLLNELTKAGRLKKGKRGDIWFSGIKMPQRSVEIRGIGNLFRVIDEHGNTIGELDGMRVYREGHPGAIYLHRGRQFRVEELLLESRKIIVREVDVNYYTQPLSVEETEILEQKDHLRVRQFNFYWGRLRISQRIIGYERRHIYTRKRLSRHLLEMPEYIFDTEGLWMVIPEEIKVEICARGLDLAGTVHATEHVCISAMPLFVLCEKMDIGGHSYTLFQSIRSPCIFIYDGYEGGVGYCRHVFQTLREWLSATHRMVEDCNCDGGCPSCVQDPQCGSGNQPLDKEGAKTLLSFLISAFNPHSS